MMKAPRPMSVMAAPMPYPTDRGNTDPNPPSAAFATKRKQPVTMVINKAGIRVIRYQSLPLFLARYTEIAHNVTVASTWLAQAK